MAEIALNFINNSNDENNSSIVIFQQNVQQNYDQEESTEGTPVVAWRVISSSPGLSQTIMIPEDLYISAGDSFGNPTATELAKEGDKWDVTNLSSGLQLSLSKETAADTESIEIVNNLPKGAIYANIYRDGRLLAFKTGIGLQQAAVFMFAPTIFTGVAKQVEEGEILILSGDNAYTEISLIGISKADLVLTGGGKGSNAQPYMFSMTNIVFA
jgi:hypothetical protein